jgi:hypothetical protein
MKTFNEIVAEYAPYDKQDGFRQGFDAYRVGNYSNPYIADSVSAQAWDRGLECAMRFERGR